MDISIKELTEKLRRGTSLEEATKDQSWRDFEAIVSEIFSENGYRNLQNFRFSSNKRRFEIDVVAIDRPRIILADCKHWGIRMGKPSALRVAACAQVKRGKEFGNKIQEFKGLGLAGWDRATIIPILVTLYQELTIKEGDAWVVPLSKLNSFLEGVRSGFFDGDATIVPRRISSWIIR